jgi:hypothetical protein
MKRSSKNRLMPRHGDLFPDDTLFHRIARTVCRAGVLPRKELYEAWETARRVRRRFRGGRVVDLACGHGLLAQIMLILDQTSPLALAVDAVRAVKLRGAGYEIYTAAIPAAVTPKNRLLMGSPGSMAIPL